MVRILFLSIIISVFTNVDCFKTSKYLSLNKKSFLKSFLLAAKIKNLDFLEELDSEITGASSPSNVKTILKGIASDKAVGLRVIDFYTPSDYEPLIIEIASRVDLKLVSIGGYPQANKKRICYRKLFDGEVSQPCSFCLFLHARLSSADRMWGVVWTWSWVRFRSSTSQRCRSRAHSCLTRLAPEIFSMLCWRVGSTAVRCVALDGYIYIGVY